MAIGPKEQARRDMREAQSASLSRMKTQRVEIKMANKTTRVGLRKPKKGRAA